MKRLKEINQKICHSKIKLQRETCLDAAGWLAVLAGRRNPSGVVVEADRVAAAVVAAAYSKQRYDLKTNMLFFYPLSF